MRTFLALTLTLLAVACGGGGSSSVNSVIVNPPPVVDSGLRLVQVSQTVPTTDTVVARKANLEKAPYQGTMVALNAGRIVFQLTTYSDASLAGDRANLPTINSTTLTDNFLLMRGGATTSFDLFDDAQWAAAESNIRTFAQMAKLGSLAGIAFDPEGYPPETKNLFTYTNYDSALHSFSDCETQMRTRGGQFMSAIQEEYPSSRVFLFGGLSNLKLFLENLHADPTAIDTLKDQPYGLMPAFLNGMLDVLDASMELVDGNEATYTYYRSSWYTYEMDTVVRQYGLAVIDSANQTRFKKQVKLATSVYLDASFDLSDNSSYLAHWLAVDLRPDLFQYQIFYGLSFTDRYMWVYSEATDWYARTNIPDGAETAMQDAMSKVAQKQTLGLPDIENEIHAAAIAGGLEW